MYAIVDIETTGGHANANGITEVAIVIYDGKEVVQRFETLINPQVPIPIYIEALTGISNEMVQKAPLFSDVAAKIFEMLKGRIFIAHNVNFDYSFLRHHLAASGFELSCKKLCTVRLSRKIFKGLPSYSLGKLCRSLQIENQARHRAAGDAESTAILFSMLLKNDTENHIKGSLKQKSKEQSLPPHLPREHVDQLPYLPGVYYFHNHKGKVIYVGKAKSLRKRVSSHFSNNSPGKQKQEFLKNINSISHQVCGTELMAFILEAIEIKRLCPAFNRSLKRFEHAYGLFSYEDQKGYLRLVVDKKRKYTQPLYSFGLLREGYNFLNRLIGEFQLCPKLCFVQQNDQICARINDQGCLCAYRGEETPAAYNLRVNEAMNYLDEVLPTYAIVGEGRIQEEKSCILMEKGQFYGMGYISGSNHEDINSIKTFLTPYPANDYIRTMMHQYSERHPARKIVFSESNEFV